MENANDSNEQEGDSLLDLIVESVILILECNKIYIAMH